MMRELTRHYLDLARLRVESTGLKMHIQNWKDQATGKMTEIVFRFFAKNTWLGLTETHDLVRVHVPDVPVGEKPEELWVYVYKPEHAERLYALPKEKGDASNVS